MTEQKTLIGLAGGEWQPTTLAMFDAANMSLDNGGNQRKYEFQFKNPNRLPALDFLFCRTKDAIRFITDSDSNMQAATIGSDYAIEQNFPYSYILPLYQLLPSATQACLYIAATKNWPDVDFRNPQWEQLNGSKIFTPYPNIAKKYLKIKGVKNSQIEYAAGKIEGLSRAFPKNLAYIDLKSDKTKSPRTGDANGNSELDTIMNVDLVLVLRPDLASIDDFNLYCLTRKFYQALQRRQS